MSEHQIYSRGTWRGTFNGTGEIVTDGLRSPISRPVEIGGPGIGCNPEELMLGASSSCYLITLSIALGKKRIPFERIDIASEVVVEFGAPPRIKKFTHSVRIFMQPHVSAEKIALAKTVAVAAEERCMISRAMRGNVAVEVENCDVVMLAPTDSLSHSAMADQLY